MTNGVWFAMCESGRAISIDALAERLKRRKNVEVRFEGSGLVLEISDRLMGLRASLWIAFVHEPHVAVEAAEVAERHDRPELATLDARYELVFDAQQADSVYNTLVHVASVLEEASGAIVYDATTGRFI